ncbi:MAG: hypothetical protein H0W72_06870 [Planctomycetes bacterium]|nr:hypothetical protein [Planctomycetota bacterium]
MDGEAAVAAVPAPRRWTRILINSAVVGLILVLVVGFGAVLLGAPLPLHLVLGVFLCCFAGLKIGVACDAIVRMRDHAGDIDPRATHGSPGLAWGWIIYKFVAAAVALGVAIYAFTGAADRLDDMFRPPAARSGDSQTLPR